MDWTKDSVCSVCHEAKPKHDIKAKVSGDGSRAYTICSSCNMKEEFPGVIFGLILIGLAVWYFL